MINVTDLKNGTYYQENGAPLEVMSYEHIKMGRGNATIKIKVKNLLTGAIVNKGYISGKKVEEADLRVSSAVFKYRTSSDYIFFDEDDEDEVELDKDAIGKATAYLIKNMTVKIVYYNDHPIAVRLPIKVAYAVKEAPPDARGNSANASYKEVVLENNLRVRTPMFIKTGDRVVIDTRNSDYVSRE